VLSLLTRLVIAAPKRVLLTVVLLTVLAGAFGTGVDEHLGAAGFQDPGSPSARGVRILTDKYGQGDMDVTLVVRAPGRVLDQAATATGHELVARLRNSAHVSHVESPWDGSPQSSGLISKDGKTGRELPVFVDQLRHAVRPTVCRGGGGAAAPARSAVRACTLRPAGRPSRHPWWEVPACRLWSGVPDLTTGHTKQVFEADGPADG
jgi:hypothetical protein